MCLWPTGPGFIITQMKYDRASLTTLPVRRRCNEKVSPLLVRTPLCRAPEPRRSVSLWLIVVCEGCVMRVAFEASSAVDGSGSSSKRLDARRFVSFFVTNDSILFELRELRP